MGVTNETSPLTQGMEERGINERIISRHEKLGAPSTFRYGSDAINTIYAHKEMEIILRGG